MMAEQKGSHGFDKAKYDQQYMRENINTKRVPFNRKNPDDMTLLRWAEDREESFSAYVKRLIEQDMIAAQRRE